MRLEQETGPAVQTEAETPEMGSDKKAPRRKAVGPSFFTLSGGILRRDHRTSNRIDALLSKVMQYQPEMRYSPQVEKNLDYLQTSLQLDMITIAAELYKPQPDEEEEERPLE